jgi:hypothetical protein
LKNLSIHPPADFPRNLIRTAQPESVSGGVVSDHPVIVGAFAILPKAHYSSYQQQDDFQEQDIMGRVFPIQWKIIPAWRSKIKPKPVNTMSMPGVPWLRGCGTPRSGGRLARSR